ncbi:DUF1674-domain-containing protein [Dothidotthia symphoricarpi CBS 119687]|uniref:Succinate dehydrogenase assembly factor 4, mitochondrial n=1 Tax=Dothidotthia symphoricarpi CBS 119687 TaxID=1392245 RepID=A0A6A6AHJ6_9PLEO|nr:DUF1674-domain-containing protein [Dothidotthia symphoricarpi CBS 119687]KAF2130723.1 DUF1674-domain-containing protein [Dothidotthia symphoricarpi CBS 119687]
MNRTILLRRAFSTTPRHAASPFTRGPAPIPLPKQDQDLFEKLQKASTGAFSTPRSEDTKPEINVATTATSTQTASTATTSPSQVSARSSPQINQSPSSTSGDDLHPNMRRGAPPEFDGEINPKTGEVGGPKNEPLRWGAVGDWSYNGRVTDF